MALARLPRIETCPVKCSGATAIAAETPDRVIFHLYLEIDDADAAAAALKANGVVLVKDVHETPWGTREFVIKDDQGHTLYFGERGEERR